MSFYVVLTLVLFCRALIRQNGEDYSFPLYVPSSFLIIITKTVYGFDSMRFWLYSWWYLLIHYNGL